MIRGSPTQKPLILACHLMKQGGARISSILVASKEAACESRSFACFDQTNGIACVKNANPTRIKKQSSRL